MILEDNNVQPHLIKVSAPVWRANGTYLANLASKAGLLEESRLFVEAYAELGQVKAAVEELRDTRLTQRSRNTRITILREIQLRLIRWNPPAWVLDDLIWAAKEDFSTTFKLLLLLHIARQDILLYDICQELIFSNYSIGEFTVVRADVQKFLDKAIVNHPEIERWSISTREKVAGNALSVLQDYGLLKGKFKKQIIEPAISSFAVKHLVRLLKEEGTVDFTQIDSIAAQTDWHIWLLNSERAKEVLLSTDLD